MLLGRGIRWILWQSALALVSWEDASGTFSLGLKTLNDQLMNDGRYEVVDVIFVYKYGIQFHLTLIPGMRWCNSLCFQASALAGREPIDRQTPLAPFAIACRPSHTGKTTTAPNAKNCHTIATVVHPLKNGFVKM